MIRRLEGPQLNPSQVPPSTHGTDANEDSRLPPVVRRQLMGLRKASQRRKNVEIGTAGGPEEALFPGFGVDAGGNSGSIDEILDAFVRPRVSDAGVLRRSLPILRHFVEEIIPRMEGGEQFKHIAATLVQDEINKHRELLQRRQKRGDS